MRNSGKRKTLSGALVLSLVTALMPMNANAVEPETAPDVVPDFVLPDTIEPEEAERYKYVGRDYEAETNLSMFVFKNADDTNTMRVFGYPVKYIDESGKTRDISLKVKEDGRGGYETAENNIITNFPGELS